MFCLRRPLETWSRRGNHLSPTCVVSFIVHFLRKSAPTIVWVRSARQGSHRVPPFWFLKMLQTIMTFSLSDMDSLLSCCRYFKKYLNLWFHVRTLPEHLSLLRAWFSSKPAHAKANRDHPKNCVNSQIWNWHSFSMSLHHLEQILTSPKMFVQKLCGGQLLYQILLFQEIR